VVSYSIAKHTSLLQHQSQRLHPVLTCWMPAASAAPALLARQPCLSANLPPLSDIGHRLPASMLQPTLIIELVLLLLLPA